VSSLGDIDNDGHDDILIGASGGRWNHGDASVRVISSNGDWDNDGVGTLNDAYPLDPTRQ